MIIPFEKPAQPIKCSLCGGKIPMEETPMQISHDFGYGSKHDMKRMEMNLCVPCTDKVVAAIEDLLESNVTIDSFMTELE